MGRSVTPRTGHATARIGTTIVAETDSWNEVEGNVYFPPDAVKRELLTGPTGLTTHCPWKGDAEYYTITADGEFSLKNVALGGLRGGLTVGAGTEYENAAWFYAKPFDTAPGLKDFVAFCK